MFFFSLRIQDVFGYLCRYFLAKCMCSYELVRAHRMFSFSIQTVPMQPVIYYGRMIGENPIMYIPSLGRYVLANFGFLGDDGNPRPWHTQPFMSPHRKTTSRLSTKLKGSFYADPYVHTSSEFCLLLLDGRADRSQDVFCADHVFLFAFKCGMHRIGLEILSHHHYL